MTHKIKLPNASVMLLTSVLSADGWASTVQDIYQAGSLLCETFSKFEPKRDDKGAVDAAWAWELSEWELNERQRECCKRAIQGISAIKKMPTGRASFELVKAFGLE